MIANTNHSIYSPVRRVSAKVELYKDSALAYTWTNKDRIKKITIERVGDETKFFGYGICQKANIHLIDVNKEITDYTTQCYLKLFFTSRDTLLDDYEYLNILPQFYITRCIRDENTNELSITAYDALYNASNHTLDELGITPPYYIRDVANAISVFLTGKSANRNLETSLWDIYYEEGANYSGGETLREVLDDIAEVTTSIYFISADGGIKFVTLRNENTSLLTIDKSKYITLVNKENRRLGAITHTTELGDNITASGTQIGTTQYIRDNPFFNLIGDIDIQLQRAWEIVQNLTINQFDCLWRGNFYLELGDRFSLIGKDNNLFYSFLLNDVWEYDGAFRQKTQWVYTNSDTETAAAPATIGNILKDTYAKVDKVNKEIELVAQDVENIPQEIAAIKLTTSSITSSVQSIEREIGAQGDRLTEVEGAIENYSTQLEQTAEQIKIEIKEEILNEGVTTSVTTTTGFTFNEEGLKVEKSGSEMSTLISEDGMTIYRGNTGVLTADNTGVYAANLRATTYLIIGVNSRFEDYDNNQRTGCFWIGGINK